tara:strand:+ start:296 stop:514 length:219 start_codon:yes stop_codon:yes gene_type:complete
VDKKKSFKFESLLINKYIKMTYDEAIKLTDLRKKLNILCDKFDKAKNLKKIIKKMSYEQLLQCKIMLLEKIK